MGLARRTSPTNLGLFLTAALAALDLGLTTPERVRPMLEGFFDSLSRLERWHGHFYNWYDTARLCPLRPAYVSTVDSGNLAACLPADGLRGAGRIRLRRAGPAGPRAV